jgi:hypothetical protein
MPLGIEKVNIFIHGLFFMRKNGDNLEIFAPNIKNHHFIGGVRGTRKELSGKQDLLPLGLVGKIGSGLGTPSPDDVDGSIMQFPASDVKDFTSDPTKFVGSILLPWPIKFISLRKGDITTRFRYVPTSKLGAKIEVNARRKGRDDVGVVTLLQYTLPVISSRSEASQFNIHYYLQPCKPHKVPAVNVDLKQAAYCFVDYQAFDLLMIEDGKDPDPTPASGNSDLGTTVEDEQSIDEEFDESPDIKLICKNDPLSSEPEPASAQPTGPGVPAVSPANCPTFFVL